MIKDLNYGSTQRFSKGESMGALGTCWQKKKKKVAADYKNFEKQDKCVPKDISIYIA